MSESLEFDVTLYPEPVLRRTAEPVEVFDEALQATIEAMFARMFASHGVGLAAPQVGLRQRILVMNQEGDPEQPELNLVLVNPKITDRSGDKTLMEEGCLSFPNIFAEVARPENCTVEAQDANGDPVKLELTGFKSRVLQHEYDHLEGVLLVDRMSPADRLRNKTALENMIEDYKKKRAGV